MTSAFPSHPSKRRVVVVLDRHEVEKCSLKGDTQILNDAKVCVLVSDEEDTGGHRALTNIVNAGLDTSGTVLVQSPFDHNRYVEAHEAASVFALQKKVLFSLFCQYLGARRLAVTEVEIEENGKTTKFDAGLNAGLTAANASVSREYDAKHVSELMLVDTFDGTSVDIAAAERLLSERNLLNDSNMEALLHARSHGGNAMRSRKLMINLSSEAGNSLKIAAGLKAPTIGLDANFSSSVEANRTYRLTVEVTFSED